MKVRRLRDIQTNAMASYRRRRRTPHGAYLELSAIARLKERLLQESRSSAARIEDIRQHVHELDRQAAMLLQYVERLDPDLLLEEPRAGRGEGREEEGSEQDPDFLSKEFFY